MLRDTPNTGLFFSVMLHASIVALTYVGIPYMQRQVVETPPVFMEIPVIEEITAAPPPPTPEPVKEPEPVAPTTETQTAEALPTEAMPPPPEKVTPLEEQKKPDVPIVKPPPRKPAPPDTKKRDVAMLQSLLKDMQKNAPKPKPQADAKTKDTAINIAPNIGERASMTEKDAIIRHIESCWRIDPGTEGVEKLSVEARVYLNPDGSVLKFEFVDMARYFVDAQFRTLANSARNAVLGCGKIPMITPANYATFKEMVLTFSPQGRIN
ncbi:MAG: cell envelope integrity protein TolA [Rhodospirillaceae bacterium]